MRNAIRNELQIKIEEFLKTNEITVLEARSTVREDYAAQVRARFDKARKDAGIPKSAFQLRDLRAKAGTDKAENSGDILQARDQLGHTTVTITEAYIRDRKGKKVMPTK